MFYYDYDKFKNDTRKLIKQLSLHELDTIVAIARGGLMLSHALAQGLDIRDVQSVSTQLYDQNIKRDKISLHVNCNLLTSKKVLIADDIADSGLTLKSVKEELIRLYPECDFKTVTLFYKKDSIIQPDFTLNEATDWIEFFWEKDFIV